jgi:hypothetical protein
MNQPRTYQILHDSFLFVLPPNARLHSLDYDRGHDIVVWLNCALSSQVSGSCDGRVEFNADSSQQDTWNRIALASFVNFRNLNPERNKTSGTGTATEMVS